MNGSKVKKAFLTIVFLIGLAFAFSVFNKVNAQSVYLSPATGGVSVGGSQAIEVRINVPGTTNAAQIDLTVPTPLNVTGVTLNPSLITAGGCAAGSANFSTNQVCFSVAKGSDFTANELLGTFTVTGTTSGSSTVTHGSTSSLAGGGTDYPLTGQAGIYTVGSGLPSTAISLAGLKEYQALIIAFFLIDLGLLGFVLGKRKIKA